MTICNKRQDPFLDMKYAWWSLRERWCVLPLLYLGTVCVSELGQTDFSDVLPTDSV